MWLLKKSLGGGVSASGRLDILIDLPISEKYFQNKSILMMTCLYKVGLYGPCKLKCFFLLFLLIIIIWDLVSELKHSSKMCKEMELSWEQMPKVVLHLSTGPQARTRFLNWAWSILYWSRPLNGIEELQIRGNFCLLEGKSLV